MRMPSLCLSDTLFVPLAVIPRSRRICIKREEDECRYPLDRPSGAHYCGRSRRINAARHNQKGKKNKVRVLNCLLLFRGSGFGIYFALSVCDTELDELTFQSE